MFRFFAETNGKPQVHWSRLPARAARTLTAAAEGAELTSGRRAARFFYLARDPAPEEEQRRRKEGSFAMRADAPAPPTRLWRQTRRKAAARPDGARPVRGRVLAFGRRSIDRVRVPDRRVFRAVPDAASIRSPPREPAGGRRPPRHEHLPRYSPDGKWIAFVTTNERSRLTAS
mgnify:CR=1 FL=1